MIDIHGRAIRSRIDRWRDAGLIDHATAARLLAFESPGRAGRPSTLTLIGALSVALGIVAVVSANWEAIPVAAKLGGHVALNLALGLWAAAVVLKDRPGTAAARKREGLLLVLSASTLALLAHVGQSFQLQGSGFGLLAAWLALVTPFTVAFGRGAASRWSWTAGLFVTAGFGFAENAEALAEARLIGTSVALFLVAGYAAPLLAGGAGPRAAWGRHLHLVMLGTLVLLTSAAQHVWRFDGEPPDPAFRMDALAGAACATLGLAAVQAAFAWRRAALPWPANPWLTAFVVASPAYAVLPLLSGGAGSPVVEAIAVCLYWWAASHLAHAAGRTALYRLAILAIALRLFLVFLEAFSGLLFTGVGLIACGLLLLALGYGVRRILKRTPPPAPSSVPP